MDRRGFLLACSSGAVGGFIGGFLSTRFRKPKNNTEDTLIDGMMFRLQEKIDYETSLGKNKGINSIISWGAFSDPCMCKQRRWGWYAWVETKEGSHYAIAGDAFISTIDTNGKDYLANKDRVTTKLRMAMGNMFGFRKFMLPRKELEQIC